MGLTAKFNLILITVLGIGFVVIGLVTRTTLYDNAYYEVLEQAGLMMDSALAVRSYTVKEIRPLLTPQLETTFPPQIVPAYAATQSFNKLHASNPEYTYKEATLNPTNPRDRAVDWETDIISMFRNRLDLNEFIGKRETPGGRSLYLARPIRIENEACLTCHSTPAAAPKTMLARYGNANGFGWKMHEVVGAQIVSIPMGVPIAKAQSTLHLFMTVLALVFVAVLLLINLLLKLFVINPIQRMSNTANEISQGGRDVAEFEATGKDELSVLAASFNRMRRSLEKAMSIIDSGQD
jgi:HAMP domain-containing protein